MRSTPASQGFDLPPQAAGTSTTAIPQVTNQETLANLANGASIDFDFNIGFNPVFDMFVFADAALIVRVFVRQSVTDTYRQLGGDYGVAASTMTHVLNGLRLPGAQARIRLLNSSGGATTALSAQVHSRSL